MFLRRLNATTPLVGRVRQQSRVANRIDNVQCRSQSTSYSDEERRHATLHWLESVVIEQKLCPFAPPVRQAPQLRIYVSNGTTYSEIVKEVEEEVELLVGMKTVDLENRPETTLIVLNEEKCSPLQDFRELVRLSWMTQEEAICQHDYTSLLQQVLFHPLATHDTYAASSSDVDGDDPADYTIRSPFPMIHLLREEDVMKAVQSGYKDLEGLPSRNKARMRQQGIKQCAQRLDACYKQR